MKVFFTRTHEMMSDTQHILFILLGIYISIVLLILMLTGVIQSGLALGAVLFFELTLAYLYATMAWHEHRLEKSTLEKSDDKDLVLT